MHAELELPLNAYVEALKNLLRERLQGIYLTGSVALGAYHPGRSDIDATVVVASALTDDEFARVFSLHSDMRRAWPKAKFETQYVTPDVPGKLPGEAPPICAYHDGKLVRRSYFNVSLITWFTLKKHGVTLYGPKAQDLGFEVNMAVLKAKMLENLNTYWAGWNSRIQKICSIQGIASLTGRMIEWGVLGVSRLHYTFLENDITSKEGAGQYLLRQKHIAGEYSRILNEALHIRCGTGARQYISPLDRRRDAIRFIDYIIRKGDGGGNMAGSGR